VFLLLVIVLRGLGIRGMKPICVVLLDGGGVELAKLGFPAYRVEDKEAVTGVVAEAYRECSYIGVVGRGAWRVYNTVYYFLEENGLNPLILTAVDTELEPLLIGVPPSLVVLARLSARASSRSREAPYAVEAKKKISRRVLLSRGVAGLRRYVSGPRLLSFSACSGLRYCSECVSACPFDALEGKPPRLVVGRCFGCGVCLSSCPLGLLESSGVSSREVEAYLRLVLRGEDKRSRVVVVFVCALAMADFLERIRGVDFDGRLVVVPVFCFGEATVDIVARLVVGGAGVVVYCPEGRSLCLDYGVDAYEELLGGLISTGRVLYVRDIDGIVDSIASVSKHVDRYFDTSVFDLPKDIEFQDMASLMNMNPMMNAGAIPTNMDECSVCKQIPNTEARKECEKSCHEEE